MFPMYCINYHVDIGYMHYDYVGLYIEIGIHCNGKCIVGIIKPGWNSTKRTESTTSMVR